jgi:hypothetical protein
MKNVYGVIIFAIIVGTISSAAIILISFLKPSQPLQPTFVPPPPTPCKVKVKVDADGKLVLDLQSVGTAPLPDFDMSEWQSSLDAWRENPSAAEVERLKKRRMLQQD